MPKCKCTNANVQMQMLKMLTMLNAQADKFVEVADVPKEFYMEEGNLVTFDADARV